MAGEARTATDALAFFRALEQTPYQFDLFQALRRLECAYPQKPRLGSSLRPADDPVRLGQPPSLAFPPATVESFTPGGPGEPPRLEQQAFGLFGANGPLPLHLTDHARDRDRNAGDATFARFADVFHHRLISLLYRAWSSAQPTTSFDRPSSDRFSAYVGSTFGLGTAALRRHNALPDHFKLHFAGRLACQTRNPDGLRVMLEEFFHVPARIDEFVGHWMTLPEDYRCRLGDSPQSGSLGMNATIGARVWDCQHKFRIALGPMRLDDYRRLLPGGESLKRLVALVRGYAGLELDWELNLVLKREEVPTIQLGTRGALGWTSWLVSATPPADVDDLRLEPLTSVA